MKKTLFLAAVMACVALPSQATEQLISDSTTAFISSADPISVGTYQGPGSVTVTTDTNLVGSLFIGGKGYGHSEATEGNNGTVTVTNGNELTATSISVGNSEYKVTGELKLEENATVITNQLVVGLNNGTGIVTVADGAALKVLADGQNEGIMIGGAVSSDTEAMMSGTGTVTIEKGGSLDAAQVFVGGYGDTQAAAGNYDGTLNIYSDDVDITNLYIGSGIDTTGSSSATGVVNVATGTTADAVTIQLAEVANNGTLNVSGAALDVVGVYADGDGQVNVSGASALTSAVVALTDDAALTLSDAAATVTVTNLLQTESDSQVTVDGASLKTNALYAYDDSDLSVSNSGKLTVTEDGVAGLYDNTTLTADNSAKIVIAEDALLDLKDNANVVVNNGSKLNADAGATIVLENASRVFVGETSVTDTTGSSSSVDLASDSVLDFKDSSRMYFNNASTLTSKEGSSIYFTITADNYKDGNIEFQDDASAVKSQSQKAIAYVRFSADMADKLLSQTDKSFEVVLTKNATGTQQVSFEGGVEIDDDYKWVRTNGTTKDIGFTETDQKGTVLSLGQDLVAEIVQDLSVDATTATVNSLNVSMATMGAIFDVVKTQIQAPHNMSLPVGKVATDSKLAFSGRYLPGVNRVWGAGLGMSDRRAADGRGQGYHYEGGGYAVGYDRTVSENMFLGASIGQMFGRYKAGNDLMKDRQNSVDFVLYGRHTTNMRKSDNRLNIDAYLGVGNGRNRATGAFYAGGPTATGRWNDTTLGGGVTVSYDIVLSDSSMLTPFVGIEGLYAWQDDFRMSTGSNYIDYTDGKSAMWTMPVGVTYRYTYALDLNSYLIPEVTVAYLGDVSRKNPSVKYNRQGVRGSAYGATPDYSGFEIEAGATYIIDSRWMTGAFYTIQERDGDCDQTVKAHVSYSF